MMEINQLEEAKIKEDSCPVLAELTRLNLLDEYTEEASAKLTIHQKREIHGNYLKRMTEAFLKGEDVDLHELVLNWQRVDENYPGSIALTFQILARYLSTIPYRVQTKGSHLVFSFVGKDPMSWKISNIAVTGIEEEDTQPFNTFKLQKHFAIRFEDDSILELRVPPKHFDTCMTALQALILDEEGPQDLYWRQYLGLPINFREQWGFSSTESKLRLPCERK